MSDFEERYQKNHKRMSLAKSAIRIGACLAVIMMPIDDLATIVSMFAVSFLLAEVIGIAEEMI
jgi:uncharacterized membrane protein HdeD (DUF308 family)